MKFKKEYHSLSKEEKRNIITQFNLEIKLSNILRKTAKHSERGKLYYILYNKFFDQMSNNPRFHISKNYKNNRINKKIEFLSKFINQSTKLIEIGTGDGRLIIGLSTYIKQAIGVDVAEIVLPSHQKVPNNIEFFVSKDGISLPSKFNYFDMAYSNQLLEHFHPYDAELHLFKVYHALAKNGHYIFQTPHKYFGPHDVSKYFYNTPKGFHIKEYCNYELYFLLKKVGFYKIKLITSLKGQIIHLPIIISIIIEYFLLCFPYNIRKSLSLKTPFRKFINGHIIAKK